MRNVAIVSSLLLAGACASDECDGETWGRYEWVADGVEGESGCHPLLAFGSTAVMDGPATEIRIGGPGALAEPRYMPLPFCLVGIELLNIDLRTGEAGTVAPTAEIPDRRTPAFWVRVDVTRGDHAACGEIPPATTGGSWRILQGGTWGSIIDVEVRDVTFEPFDGHELVIPYGRWVARLPLDPIRYP
jgi:hypothetical protein